MYSLNTLRSLRITTPNTGLIPCSTRLMTKTRLSNHGAHASQANSVRTDIQDNEQAATPHRQIQSFFGLIEARVGLAAAQALQDFVVNVLLLLKAAIKLIMQMKAYTAAIEKASPAKIVEAPPIPVKQEKQQPALSPLQRFSFATVNTVTRLRQTLLDATGTLEAKQSALDITSCAAASGLFDATCKAAVGSLTRAEGKAASRVVVEQEEALRQQVFAQIYAELSLRDSLKPGYSS